MKKQSGFTIIEILLVIILVVGVIGLGYYVWYRNQSSSTASTNGPTMIHTGTTSYQSPATATAQAPVVTDPDDLNSAYQALNQTDPTTNNTDNAQLSSQTDGF